MRAFWMAMVIGLIGSHGFGQNISVNLEVSCEGQRTTFFVQYPKAISTYSKAELFFGDGQSVDLLLFKNPSQHHYYYKVGTYKPRLELSENGQSVVSVAGNTLRIKAAPDFQMWLSGKDSLCFDQHLFKWQGPWKSKEGLELSKWEWDLGDGTKMNQRDVQHSYSSPGNYTVALTCRDEEGCEATKVHEVVVHDSFSVRFRLKQESVLPGSKVIFTNLSTIDSSDIDYWVWDLGKRRHKGRDTFNFNSPNTPWKQLNATYSNTGFSMPKLIIATKQGCQDSFQIKDGVRIDQLRFDIASFPVAPCYQENTIRFNMPPSPNATSLGWTFGDSTAALRSNYDEYRWSPSHSFSQPGYYNINLEVLKPPLPMRDTTYCFVKVKGPQAKILKDGVRNNHLPLRAIAPSEFRQLKNVHYRLSSGKDSIRYWRIQKVKPFVVDSIAEYFNAPMQVSKAIENICQGDTVWKPVYKLEPTSYQKVWQDYVVVDSGYWHYLDALPTETLYAPEQGSSYPHNMHDTDLYHPAPFNLVQFTNNSTKYRLWGDSTPGQKPPSIRYAWDNIPGEFPDKGRNPNHPWASDSMQYFWDFGDSKAPQCTSTVAAPNVRCAYSTEVAPRHMYIDMGMYQATLKVTDTICRCEDLDTVIITMRTPQQVLARSKYLNWYQQERFESLGKNQPLGLRIRGHNCANDLADQRPDFEELGLDPDFIDDYWLVFDANEQCDTIYYQYQRNGQTRDSFYLNCDWISKKEFEANQSIYNYKTGGWKSIGLILKIGDQFDTLFVKDYKWVHHPIPQATFQYQVNELSDSFELQLNLRDSTSTLDSTRVFQYWLSGLVESTYPFIADSITQAEGADETYRHTLPSHQGHWLVVSGTSTKNHCTVTRSYYIHPRISLGFEADKEHSCINEPVHFKEQVYYYQESSFERFRMSRSKDTLYYPDQWIQYSRVGPSTKRLFNDTIRAELRKKWQQNPGYQLPAFEEQLAWDFDGDSIFDAYGNGPTWTYDKPGTYEPRLYVRDSTGFWLRKGLSEPVVVSAALPLILADTTATTLVCTGNPINFSAETEDTVSIKNYEWTVSPGGVKGTRATFQWIPNEAGSYTIHLQTTRKQGCQEKATYGPITVRSPIAGFQIAPYQDSCTGKDFELRNTSTGADSLYWLLNGNVLAKTDGQIPEYNLSLPYFGNHFLSQLAVGTLYDSLANEYRSCSDAYPNKGLQELHIPGNPNSDFKALRELSDWGTVPLTAVNKNAAFYLWSTDGGTVLTRSDTFFLRKGLNGDYEVCLEVIDPETDCSSKTCKTIWIRDLGLENATASGIQVFPTLVQQEFTIKIDERKGQHANYQLYNISGVELQKGSIDKGNHTVDCSQLKAGTYFVKVQSADQVYDCKLIKL